jgi:hypothetical protein
VFAGRYERAVAAASREPEALAVSPAPSRSGKQKYSRNEGGANPVVYGPFNEEIAMNTANLQLEGLVLAFSSLLETLRRKGLLTEDEILDALSEAETSTKSHVAGMPNLSASNLDAIQFPIRFLRAATNAATPGHATFMELAAKVAETKPER